MIARAISLPLRELYPFISSWTLYYNTRTGVCQVENRGFGVFWGGKIGVENSLDHVDRTLRCIIIHAIRKSPVQGNTTSRNQQSPHSATL